MLKDFIIDSIQNTDIFEMAFNKKKAEEKISALSRPIYLHLIKILYWKDDDNYSKHIKDINTWLNQVDQIVIKGNKRPSKKDYLNWLFNEPFGNGPLHLEKIIRKSLHEYHRLPKNGISIDSLYSILMNTYNKLATDLSLDIFDDIRKYGI